MYKVQVDGSEERTTEISGNEILFDGKMVDWNLVSIGENRFHLISNFRSYNFEVISTDEQKKKFEIKLNGKILQVTVKDRFDDLLRELGMDKASANKINVVKSPMPGLVLKILVKEGDEIITGDSLVILEAMKMENVIKSAGNGKVRSIRIKERDAVEKSQVLIEMD